MHRFQTKKLSSAPTLLQRARGLPSVSTPVNIKKLSEYLASHPDREFVQYLVSGLQHGFHIGINKLPDTSYHCKNLRSARAQPDVTMQLISKELQKGFLLGPYTVLPFDTVRINPIGIAEGKYSAKKTGL